MVAHTGAAAAVRGKITPVLKNKAETARIAYIFFVILIDLFSVTYNFPTFAFSVLSYSKSYTPARSKKAALIKRIHKKNGLGMIEGWIGVSVIKPLPYARKRIAHDTPRCL